MIESIPRKDPTLRDAIEVLDQHLVRCNNDIKEAWAALSADELRWIGEEVDRCLDQRYFLENWYCIRTENGQIKTLYPFLDQQEIIYAVSQEEWGNNGYCLLIILKGRQTGTTVYISGTMFHRTIFTPNTFTLTVAQNEKTSTHIFKMMLNAYHLMPWWLRPEYLFKQEGNYIEFQREDEKQRMTNPGLASAIQIDNAQKSTGVAIGRTVRCFHGSEISRWPDADIFTADIEPSMNAKDEYGVMESTAFGRNGLFYDHWRGSVDGETGWRALFVPVYRVKKYSLPIKGRLTLTEEEKSFTERVKREENFDIPKTFWAWRRRRIISTTRTTGGPWAHFESYPITPMEAFQSSGECAFDKTSLMYQLNKNCRKPRLVGEISLSDPRLGVVNTDLIREVRDDEILPRRKGEEELKRDRLWIWEKPDPSEVYYISGDTALGVVDGDYSVAEVWRGGIGRDPDVQVAEWWGHCPPTQFANIMAALGFWYKQAGSTASEIAVEYQGPGITAGDKLIEMDYPNLYRPRHKDRVSTQFTPYFHWVTTIKTRDLIIATMNEALLSGTVIIRSEGLIDEMFDFAAMESGGKYQGQGNTDDACMSAQIGLYCLRETTIDLRQMSDTRERAESATDTNVYVVYDNLMRNRGQYQDKNIALEVAKKEPGWCVKPLLRCKANTMYSAVHQGNGAEHDLHYRYGMPSTEILPDVVSAYKAANREPVDEQSGDLSDEW
jgi:hypothetical protein